MARRPLSADEHRRARAFSFARDRDRFVARRGLLHLLLARYVDCAPADLTFAYGPHGKPELAVPSGDPPVTVSWSQPAFAAMAQLTRHRGTRLGNAGWLLGTIGFGVLGGLALVVDVYDTHLVTQLGVEQAVALGEAADDLVAVGVLGMTGALGALLGVLLTAAGLWRSREVPVWVPALLLAGIVGFIISPSALIPTVTASSILTAGLVGVSLRILRADDWETGGPVLPARRAGQPAARADARV